MNKSKSKERSIGNIKWVDKTKCILRISAGFDDYGKRIQLTRTVTAKSETDAEKQLMQFYNEKDKLTENRVSEAPKTLSELYDEFKINHIEKLRPNTQDFYNDLWDRHLKDYGKSKLKSFTPKMVRDILNKSQVGNRTLKAIYGMLNTMFHYASIDNDYMISNPCQKVDAPKYKAPEKQVYDDDRLVEVVKLVQQECVEHQLSFALGVLLAMRRGEIMGLTWSNVNLEARELFIEQAAAHSSKLGNYIDDPKNKKSKRKLDIPDSVADLFRKLKAKQAERQLRVGSKWIKNDFVFKDWNGEPLKVEFPTHWWKEFRNANPIAQGVTFHGLRHTAATLMIKENVPISTVSGVLGHSQMSTTTDIYSHVIEDTKKSAIEVMERIVTRKNS